MVEGALRPGTVLGGRYEIVELLAHGGHGAVYRARQRPLLREVAVKVILPEAAAGPGIAERFAREVSLVQRLEHPNTVRLFDFGTAEDGTAFMVLELLRGHSLEDEMGRGPIAPVRVAKIGVQILKSLMEAHSLGVVHRDVKPGNVLLVDYAGEPDFVKVLDFGVARSMRTEQESAQRLRPITGDGQVVGTPAYMAPEQLRGEPLTHRTDLYAVGLVLAEMLAGRPVYVAPSAAELWMKQLSPEPVPLPPLARGSLLGDVLERATRKAAAERFASAAEMIEAIEHTVRQGAIAPTDPLAPPITAATPRAPPPTAPFGGGAPTAVETVVMPARTPYAMTGPPARGTSRPPTLLVVAFALAALVVVLGWALQTVYAEFLSGASRLPGGTVGPPALPFEQPEMDTRFFIRKKCEVHGWGLARAGAGETNQGGKIGRFVWEGYGVIAPNEPPVSLAVVRLEDDVAAELYAADMSSGPLRARDGKYVLYIITNGRPNTFEAEVFEALRRPL